MAKERTSLIPGLGIEFKKNIVVPADCPFPTRPVPLNVRSLIGYSPGYITVIGYIGPHIHRKQEWVAKCECGTYFRTTTFDLLMHYTRTCGMGCRFYSNGPKTLLELSDGSVIDRLTVTGYDRNLKLFKCQCLCGISDVFRTKSELRQPKNQCGVLCNMSTDEPKVQQYIQKIIDENIRVVRSNCWAWQGRITNGIPLLMNVLHQERRAARIAYMAYHGDVPYGIEVLQDCGNTQCVNPKHMSVPTPSRFRLWW